jgi:hypothetical protein
MRRLADDGTAMIDNQSPLQAAGDRPRCGELAARARSRRLIERR